MADIIAANFCRLMVRTPSRDFEIAVPTGVPIAELLPAFVSFAGKELNEVGLDHDGWVLQRLGEEPLDEDGTAADLGLRDGDTLYLQARREQLPPVHFDDLVDGVATALRERTDAWRAAYTHRMLAVLCFGVLGAGLAVLLNSGPALERAGVAAAVAFFLVIGAGVASRALGDALTASMIGLVAVPYLAVAGSLFPTGPAGAQLDGARILAAGAAGAAGAALALAAAATAAPVLLSAAFLGLLTAIGGLIMMTCGLGIPAAASVTAVLLVIVGGFIPVLSFRLSGLRLPPLPADAAQLQEGIDPHHGREVLSRAKIADQYMTCLYVASGVAALVLLTLLSLGHGLTDWTFAGVLSGLMLLHGRGLNGGWQRLSVVFPGACGGVLLPLAATWHASLGTRLSVLAAFLTVAVVLMSAAWAVPGRRLLPYWGRMADLLQAMAAMGLVPLMLLMTGFYGYLRGLSG